MFRHDIIYLAYARRSTDVWTYLQTFAVYWYSRETWFQNTIAKSLRGITIRLYFHMKENNYKTLNCDLLQSHFFLHVKGPIYSAGSQSYCCSVLWQAFSPNTIIGALTFASRHIFILYTRYSDRVSSENTAQDQGIHGLLRLEWASHKNVRLHTVPPWLLLSLK